MSKRTVKDIEAQIKELEREKNELEQKELLEKFEPLMDVLSTTTLSVAQIKKAIKDAEKEKIGKKPNKTTKKVIKNKPKNVETEKVTGTNIEKPKRKGYEKEHTCSICGKRFMAHSPRQIICPECKVNKNNSIEIK